MSIPPPAKDPSAFPDEGVSHEDLRSRNKVLEVCAHEGEGARAAGLQGLALPLQELP